MLTALTEWAVFECQLIAHFSCFGVQATCKIVSVGCVEFVSYNYSPYSDLLKYCKGAFRSPPCLGCRLGRCFVFDEVSTGHPHPLRIPIFDSYV